MSNKTLRKVAAQIDKDFLWDYRSDERFYWSNGNTLVSVGRCKIRNKYMLHIAITRDTNRISKFCTTFAEIRECLTIIRMISE